MLITVTYIQIKIQMQSTVCTLHFTALYLTTELHCFFSALLGKTSENFTVHIGPVKLLRGVGSSNATQNTPKNSQILLPYNFVKQFLVKKNVMLVGAVVFFLYLCPAGTE